VNYLEFEYADELMGASLQKSSTIELAHRKQRPVRWALCLVLNPLLEGAAHPFGIKFTQQMSLLSVSGLTYPF
jgi:hypothetical protein